ncbi:MAG: amino acid ABC transporter substrate-binding protein [Thermodesulfobacteriota bacterium]
MDTAETSSGGVPGRLCAVVLLMFAALLPEKYALCSENPPLVFGATVSGQGRYSGPARMLENGYRLWEKQVNERGGIFGRRVEVVLHDDKSRKDLARDLYRSLILEDRVDFVLSPYGTPLTMAASGVSERHGYVMLASSAAGGGIWERGFSYVFGMYSLADRYFIGMLDMMARNGYKKVALLHDATSSFNVDTIEGGRQWAERFSMDVVLEKGFKNGAQELPGIVEKIDKNRIDGLVLSAYPPDCYRFLDLLGRTGLQPSAICMTIAPVMPDFSERAGEMSENVFGPSQWEPDERIPFPGTKEFINAFVDRYGEKPSYHAGSAFASCRLLEDAMRETGSLDHDKVRDYIVSADTFTVIGRFKVDHKGRQVGHNPLTIQWQNSRKEIVWPAKLRTAEPVFNK